MLMKTQFVGWVLDVLGGLFALLPRRKNLIVFESSGDFSDNSWALYQYLRKNGRFRFVWIVSDKSSRRSDKRTKFLTARSYFDRVQLSYYFAVATVAFNTHGTVCRRRHRGRPLMVSLWHGTPLKSGTADAPPMYDYMLSIGEKASPLQARFSCFPVDKVLPLGYPRNDLLLQNVSCGADNPFVMAHDYSKVILWMPTFRASVLKELSEEDIDTETGLPLLTTAEDVNVFNKFLKTHSIFLLAKIHWLQASKQIYKETFSNIKFITDADLRKAGLQLYEIVGKSDALLTDYSSVYYDYLLVDKPEGFILDDIEEYGKSRGFVVDNALDYLPGDHIYDIAGLESFFLDVKSGRDNHRDERRRLRDEMHCSVSGGACHRIAERFGLLK